MVARYRFLILLILVLSLAGCFRQASEPVDPIAIPDTNPTMLPVITSTPVTLPQDTASPTMEVIVSTPVVLDTQPPTNVPPLQPTNTPVTGSVSEPAQMFTPSATPQFITPGAGSQDTAVSTPTPALVIATATPLTTPTDIGDSGPVVLGDNCLYTVQPGDTLFRIALNYGATLAEVVAVNPGIVPELIQPDDEIVIPDCGDSAVDLPAATPVATGIPGQIVHVVVAGDTLLGIARQYGVATADLVAANNLANPNQLAVGQRLIIPTGDEAIVPGATNIAPTAALTVTHTVKAGETMASIANQYDVRIIDIMQANGINDPNTLSVGQQLTIPPVPQP